MKLVLQKNGGLALDLILEVKEFASGEDWVWL